MEPRQLSEAEREKSISMACKGRQVNEICLALRIDRVEFWRYRKRNQAFDSELETALKEGVNARIDDLVVGAQDGDDPSMLREVAKIEMWTASRRHRDVYAETMRVETETRIDVRVTLAKARERAAVADAARVVATQLLPGDAPDAVDAHYEPVPTKPAPDTESGATPHAASPGPQDDDDIY